MSIFGQVFGTNPVFPGSAVLAQLQNVKPTLDIDFTKVSSLDKRFTFTRASAAWDWVNGELVEFPADTPRIGDNGLLLEGARTNSLRNSGFVGGSIVDTSLVNTASGVSGTAVGFGNVNGLDYVDLRFTGTATANSGIAMRFETNAPPVVAASGQTWTASAYAQIVDGTVPGSGTYFGIGVEGIQAPISRTESNTTNILSQLGTGLTRVSHTRTLNNASTNRVNGYFEFGFNNGQVVDFTVRVAATQLEQAPFASSPIITTGTALTRAADSCVITDLARIGFNSAAFTVIGEYTLQGIGGTVQRAFQVHNGTINQRMALSGQSLGTITAFTANPSTQASFDFGAPSANVLYKLAMALEINNFAGCLNGGTVQTDTSGTMPTGLNAIAIGFDGYSTTNHLFGHIRRIVYYPVRLPDAQLQEITSA